MRRYGQFHVSRVARPIGRSRFVRVFYSDCRLRAALVSDPSVGEDMELSIISEVIATQSIPFIMSRICLRPRLPQEVVDLILVEVDRKADLAACSLICRDWVVTARRRLFSSVALTAESKFTSSFKLEESIDEKLDCPNACIEASEYEPEDSEEEHQAGYWIFQSMLRAFVRFLVTAPSLASTIRRLSITGAWEPESRCYYFLNGSMLRSIVASLPCLRTLSLACVTIQYCCNSPAFADSSLRILALNDVAGIKDILFDEDLMADLLQLLHLFPTLQELDFCGDDNFGYAMDFLQSWVGCSALSRFRQRQRPTRWCNRKSRHPDPGRVGYNFLGSLIEASCKLDVHLDVEMVFPEASDGFPYSLFQRIGPQVKTLVLRLWWGEFGTQPSTLFLFSFELRVLIIYAHGRERVSEDGIGSIILHLPPFYNS